jgi:hypothetical protein
MKARLPIYALAFAASAFAIGALAPAASADAAYQTEHLGLTPVGGAALRSGFVQNIKAEGPTIYAHEIYVLNGAQPNATYTVTNNFYVAVIDEPDPDEDSLCTGDVWQFDMAVMTTNASGNAKAGVLIGPADVAGIDLGVHGVMWTVRDATNTVVYQTACTAVTID